MTLNYGAKRDDRYEIKDTFGECSMGLARLARHLVWNIDVTIKYPRPEFLKSRRQVYEFQSAYATWASLGLDPHDTTCDNSHGIEVFSWVVAVNFSTKTLRETTRISAILPKLTISRLNRIQGVWEDCPHSPSQRNRSN